MTCNQVFKPILPKTATAGLTFTALAIVPGYCSLEWTLVAHLRGPQSINLESECAGDEHKFTATAATTANWAPGVYWYSVRATNGAEVIEVGSGEIEILPDLATVGDNYDGRSEAEIGLAAIDAVLGKRATIDQQKYTINNRELWRTPIPELLKLRGLYLARVSRERAQKQGRNALGRLVRVGF